MRTTPPLPTTPQAGARAVPSLCVTGARGLVGRSLCRRLDGTGARFLSRSEPRGPEEGSSPDLATARAGDWGEALNGIETVIHLAAALPWSGVDRATMRRINVEGTRGLAEAAAGAGVGRFVFVSTLGVQGVTSGKTPFTPHDPVAPSGPYAETKYEAETMLSRLCMEAGMKLVILRPPVVYGPGVEGKLGRLVTTTGRGGRLPVGRGARGRRRMIAADNLADAVLMAARHPDASGPPLLPADAEGMSLAELAETLARLQGRSARLVPVPEAVLRTGRAMPVLGSLVERLTGTVDVDDPRLRDDLGWTPPVALADGLAAMVRGAEA